MKQRIVFIGAGNLATHLAKALQANGHSIVQVYSRTLESAKFLAQKLGTEYTSQTNKICTEADMFVVALKDSVFGEVLSSIDFGNKLVVHCSGSLPLSVLEPHSPNIGVLYPLQTFSKTRVLDFAKIPVFVEASKSENEEILLSLGRSVSRNVSVLNSEKRKALHISAVLSCNFVNHMYALAAEYLANKDIPFDVLKPLIEETADKVQNMHPQKAQTGPAVRYDKNIINDHLNQLNDLPAIQELYNSISKSIFELHQEKDL